MRILIDATPLQTGHRQRGVGTYTRELLRSLLANDRENDYGLIAHPGPFDLGPLPPNARLIRLPRPALGRLTGFITHQVLLPPLLARAQADLLHSPGFVAAFSVPGVPWYCPLPLVVTLHDFMPLRRPELSLHKPLNRAWYAWQRRIAGRASALICVSEATRQDALRYMAAPPARCVVVHEGVDHQLFHPHPAPAGAGAPLVNLPALPIDQPYILFVGGDYVNKNRPAALAAFARLVQATTLPHKLVMVGEDRATEAQLLARYPGLDLQRLHRVQHVAPHELAQLYRQADVFLFPSTDEGFGLPVLEAMASGAPVVASAVPPAVVEVAGDAALLVDPCDVDALAAAIGRVVTDRALHRRLQQAGLARAAAFTWQRTAQRTLDVYRSVTRR